MGQTGNQPKHWNNTEIKASSTRNIHGEKKQNFGLELKSGRRGNIVEKEERGMSSSSVALPHPAGCSRTEVLAQLQSALSIVKQPSNHHGDVLSGRSNYLTMQSVLFVLESLKSVALFAFLYFSMHFPVGVPRFPRLAAIHDRLRTHRSNTSQRRAQPCCNGPDEPDDSCALPSLWSPFCPFGKQACFILIIFIYLILHWWTLSPDKYSLFILNIYLFAAVRGRPEHNEDYRTIQATCQLKHLCWCYRTPPPSSPRHKF